MISIIVPVYNVSEYLDESIRSVLNQTYSNWELILIDDGSFDGSERICDEYAKRDTRIKVIHQMNSGQATARNNAFSHVKGDYLTFLDSDDYWEKNYLFDMYALACKEDADIVAVGCKMIRDKKDIGHGNIIDKELVMSGEEAFKRMLCRNGLDSNPWGKLYKSEIWGASRFPEGKFYEDIPVLYKILLRSKCVAHLGEEPLYAYRVRNNSTTGESFSEKRFSYTEFSREVYDFVCDEYPQYEREGKTFYMNAVVENYLRLGRLKSQREFDAYYKYLGKEINNNLLFILRSDYFRADTKIGVVANKMKIYRVLRLIKEYISR